MKLSEHLSIDAVACKCGCGFGTSPDDIDKRLVILYESVCRVSDSPPAVISGCRCEQHNAVVGGGAHSAHLFGMALDLDTTAQDDHEDFVDLLRAVVGQGGIGDDPERHMVHIDTGGPEQTRKDLPIALLQPCREWHYHGGKVVK